MKEMEIGCRLLERPVRDAAVGLSFDDVVNRGCPYFTDQTRSVR